jgi:hypothetical protein
VLDTEGVPQLSVAVGAVQVAIAAVSDVVLAIFTGQAVKTGNVVSLTHGFVTVTVNEQVALLLLASVAVYTTVVTPILNASPEVYVLDTEGVPQLSVAVGAVQVAIAAVSDVVLAIFAGQVVKIGFTVSVAHGFVTVIVKEQVALLFLASVAV